MSKYPAPSTMAQSSFQSSLSSSWIPSHHRAISGWHHLNRVGSIGQLLLIDSQRRSFFHFSKHYCVSRFYVSVSINLLIILFAEIILNQDSPLPSSIYQPNTIPDVFIAFLDPSQGDPHHQPADIPHLVRAAVVVVQQCVVAVPHPVWSDCTPGIIEGDLKYLIGLVD